MISSVNNANKVRVILERCEMELINRTKQITQKNKPCSENKETILNA